MTENARVLTAVRHASAVEFGKLMNASHASLRDDFDVSIPSLNALVDCLQRHPSVYGARLTGAGFGGAYVALVESGSQAAVGREALAQYASLGYRGAVLISPVLRARGSPSDGLPVLPEIRSCAQITR